MIILGIPAQKLLISAEEASQKAIDLTRKFVSFSRGSGLKKGKVILAHMFKGMEEAGLPGLNTKENFVYYIDIPQDLAPINGDEARLKQVIQSPCIYRR